jgi:hypothetical protein
MLPLSGKGAAVAPRIVLGTLGLGIRDNNNNKRKIMY